MCLWSAYVAEASTRLSVLFESTGQHIKYSGWQCGKKISLRVCLWMMKRKAVSHDAKKRVYRDSNSCTRGPLKRSATFRIHHQLHLLSRLSSLWRGQAKSLEASYISFKLCLSKAHFTSMRLFPREDESESGHVERNTVNM